MTTKRTRTPDSVRRGLASPQARDVVDAIRASVDRLLAGAEPDPFSIAESIAAHVADPREDVRRAVALSAEHFPPSLAERTLATLRDDEDSYVRQHAEASTHARARRKSALLETGTREARYEASFRAIEEKLGPAARRHAEKAAREREAFLFGQVYHEVGNAFAALRASLERGRAEAGKRAPDHETVARSIDAAAISCACVCRPDTATASRRSKSGRESRSAARSARTSAATSSLVF